MERVDKPVFERVPEPASSIPLEIDREICVGCGSCVRACPADVLYPAETKKTPDILYPGECYYCGACAMACPAGAIRIVHPLMNRVHFEPAVASGVDENRNQE